jgi:Cu/Ag efflux pump CusA
VGVVFTKYELLSDFDGRVQVKKDDGLYVDVRGKREEAARHGIETRSIMEVIESNSFDLSRPATQKTVDALRRLTVPAAAGQKIPLSAIADVSLERMPAPRVYRWPPEAKKD